MSEIDPEEEFQGPSKSQLKRDMAALRDMAAKLVDVSDTHLARVPDDDIRAAVVAARQITKGNARKRQLQYIAKLLSRTDVTPVRDMLDQLDASSTAHNQRFHQLEKWREALIEGDESVMQEVFTNHPDADRQHLRALIRNARKERERGISQADFRKLFQYLKSLG